MAGRKRVSFEGKIYHGTAGSTAATEMGNITEVTENFTAKEAEVTEKGISGIPNTAVEITEMSYDISFTMYEKDGDTSLAAIRAAAAAGTPIALRTKAYDSGIGFDGDVVIVSKGLGKPMGGAQTHQFTAKVNTRLREPQYDV